MIEQDKLLWLLIPVFKTNFLYQEEIFLNICVLCIPLCYAIQINIQTFLLYLNFEMNEFLLNSK